MAQICLLLQEGLLEELPLQYRFRAAYNVLGDREPTDTDLEDRVRELRFTGLRHLTPINLFQWDSSPEGRLVWSPVQAFVVGVPNQELPSLPKLSSWKHGTPDFTNFFPQIPIRHRL